MDSSEKILKKSKHSKGHRQRIRDDDDDDVTAADERTNQKENRKDIKEERSKKKSMMSDWMSLEDGPKSAWPEKKGSWEEMEDEEEKKKKDGKKRRKERREECETRFDNSAYVPADEDDLETLMVGLERNIELVSETIIAWKRSKETSQNETAEEHTEVEHRKMAIMEVVEEYSRRLHENIDLHSVKLAKDSTKRIESLETTLTTMTNTIDHRSEINVRHSKSLREHLLTWESERIEAESVLRKIPVVAMTTRNEEETTTTQGTMELLFGTLQMDPVGIRGNGSGSNEENCNTSLGLNLALAKGALLDCPQLISTFSCRNGKDKRTCGITDVALADNGDVFVLDKNNKTVKMFDSKGVFQTLFSKGDLRKPSRISLLRSSVGPAGCDDNYGMLAITDEASNCVLVFTLDGRYLSQLVSLQYPVGHCQIMRSSADGTEGRLAVLEFATKSIVICDFNGKIIETFATQMDCPAYIACTRSGNFVVTDWKTESIKIFDSSGQETFSSVNHRPNFSSSSSYSSSSSSSLYSSRANIRASNSPPAGLSCAAAAAEEPQGVCADDGGHVMVVDRKKRQIVVCSEDGNVIHKYDDAKHKIGFPFVLDCNRKGIIAVAEYTGIIRIFRYTTTAAASSDA